MSGGFSKGYDCVPPVYYEYYDAIAREKQIKAGNRKKKLFPIESMNAD